MERAWLLAGSGAFGWLWGSFLNTLVDRTPLRGSVDRRLGWFSPLRSQCLACGAPIAWFDNVPILSYLLLRGRCRACRSPIGARTLAVEVATPLAFTAAAWVLLILEASLPVVLWSVAALSWGVASVATVMEGRRLGWVWIWCAGVALLGIALAFM